MLAELGYVAFVSDIYGKASRPKDRSEAPKFAGQYKGDRKLFRRRLNLGLDQLRAAPGVDKGRIAAIGYCFGGSTALELGRSGAPLSAVVSFHGGLEAPKPEDARNIRAKVLVCHGASDPLIPPAQVAAFEAQMRDTAVDWQLCSYGGAVHSFTNPDADKLGNPALAYNAAADRRSWAAMLSLFEEAFGPR